ncbi:MAG: ATP synthase subunit I [Deltaproteobacteria bacterium]|nr:ATP synthase subunit I [Deltaproteobacteria bacterium]
MEPEQRIIRFVTRASMVLFLLATAAGFALGPVKFGLGVAAGGLIVTVNFLLLSRTLRKSLKPDRLATPGSVLAKYYLRFVISAVVIAVLVAGRLVHPVGLFVGLSVVVASMFLALANELKHHMCKEAS